MTKKILIGLTLVIGLALLGSAVMADPGDGMGYGYGPGYHMGYGPGSHMGYGPGYHMGYGPGSHMGYGPGPGYGRGYGHGSMMYGPDNAYDQESANLYGELYKKNLEMRALLAEPKIDEAKAKALQKEINGLREKLEDKGLDNTLAFKNKNPDWRPDSGPSGRGWGRGGGFRGGPCWQ